MAEERHPQLAASAAPATLPIQVPGAVVTGNHAMSPPPDYSWLTLGISAARLAKRCAVRLGAGDDDHWGGRNWDIEIATSPVPGGMSTKRNSRSSQNTSSRNCWIALWSIGPRQITAWSSPTK